MTTIFAVSATRSEKNRFDSKIKHVSVCAASARLFFNVSFSCRANIYIFFSGAAPGPPGEELRPAGPPQQDHWHRQGEGEEGRGGGDWTLGQERREEEKGEEEGGGRDQVIKTILNHFVNICGKRLFFAFFPLHRAQRRRLDQRSLVNSEFQSGFEGINVGQLCLAVHGNRCGKIITMGFFSGSWLRAARRPLRVRRRPSSGGRTGSRRRGYRRGSRGRPWARE